MGIMDCAMNLTSLTPNELRNTARRIHDAAETIEDRIKELRKEADSLYYASSCIRKAAAWSEDKTEDAALVKEQVAEFLGEAESSLRVYPCRDLR